LRIPLAGHDDRELMPIDQSRSDTDQPITK